MNTKNKLIAWVIGLTACLALVVTAFLQENPALYIGTLLLALPVLMGPVVTDDPKEGEALDDAAFQKRVLDGISAQKTKADELVSKYDNLTKETKAAFEDLTKIKKTANDSQANMDAMVKRMDSIQALMRREVRMAYGNPVQRIQQDEELRLRFNAAIRAAVSKDGDLFAPFCKAMPSDLVKRALGEDSSPGSTMINDALAREMYDTLATYGIWNTLAVRRLGTKITKYPVKTARPVAGFVLTEAGQISDATDKAGTSVSLEVEVIAVLLNVAVQLLQDAEFDVTGDVLDDFAEALAYRLDWAAFAADGGADATDGGMTGIFEGATAAAAASGNTTTETTDLEDWTKCLLTVDSGVLTRPCRWWLHPQILVRALAVKDLNGRPIFLTAAEAPSPGGIGTILGYPVTLGHACPSTNSASAKIAVFGDPNAYVVGVRSDFTFEASDQFRWDYLQRSFRGYGRAGTKMRRAQGLARLTLAGS